MPHAPSGESRRPSSIEGKCEQTLEKPKRVQHIVPSARPQTREVCGTLGRLAPIGTLLNMEDQLLQSQKPHGNTKVVSVNFKTCR